jgi:hypothetical protein
VTRASAVDIEARETGEQLERAAATDNAPLALEAAKRFKRAGLAITVCARDFVSPPAAAPSSDYGRPFPAKFGGWCGVCGKAIAIGEAAVYRATDKTIAHPQCGAAR